MVYPATPCQAWLIVSTKSRSIDQSDLIQSDHELQPCIYLNLGICHDTPTSTHHRPMLYIIYFSVISSRLTTADTQNILVVKCLFR
jgi:hypothetical protein